MDSKNKKMHQMFSLKNGTSLIVREANYNDAIFINQMIAQIFSTTDQVLTSLDEFRNSMTLNEQLTRIKDYLESPCKCLLVAEVGQKLVGTLDFWNGHRKRIEHTGEFGMGVVSEYRNLGVGKCMIEFLLKWATENPIIEKVKLCVFASNENGIHLYKKMGFIEEGRRIAEIKMEDGKYLDVIEMYVSVKNT